MKKFIIALVLIIVIVGGAAFALSGRNDSAEENTSQTPSAGSENSGETLQTFTASDVAEHSTEDDCWTIINGQVYDITEYIPRHQGGDEILRACGVDSTTLFTERRTEDGQPVGDGTPHSSRAEADLSELFIGTLAQ